MIVAISDKLTDRYNEHYLNTWLRQRSFDFRQKQIQTLGILHFTVVFATKNDHTVLGYTDTHQKFKKKIKSRFIGWI